MRKKLPIPLTSRGFTLIELMVVVTIIAILSLVGMAVFSGVQSSARNATRRADIDAIAKALEVNYRATGYVQLATTQFTSGSIPLTDPRGNVYCGFPNSIATTTNITGSTTTTCTGGTAGWAPISTTVPVPATGATSWRICAWLETVNGTAPSPQAYCKSNAQ